MAHVNHIFFGLGKNHENKKDRSVQSFAQEKERSGKKSSNYNMRSGSLQFIKQIEAYYKQYAYYILRLCVIVLLSLYSKRSSKTE